MIYGLMIQEIKIITIKFILMIIPLAMKNFADQMAYIMRMEY